MITTVFNPKQLERAMQRKGYTAADLAFHMRANSGGRLKTTESQVYKWLRGDHQPSGEAVLIAARVLDVTVEALYESTGEDDEEASLLRDLDQLPADLRLRVVRVLERRGVEVGG